MKKLVTLLICIAFNHFILFGQDLQYSPSIKLTKTVDQFYYDSEFIYLENSSTESVPLEFTVVENSLLGEWSASICTNLQCFNKVVKTGSLGSISPGDNAYFLFSLGANETVGEGQVRILITSPENNDLSDTITFKYVVTEDGSIEAGPWANPKFEQGIFTVLLAFQNIETQLMITSLDGKVIYQDRIRAITSFPLRDYPAGIYIYKIEDANGRILKDKLLNF